jgi:hypothetical protein
MPEQTDASLLTALRPLGPFQQEVKKTSIHLVRGGSAVAGGHPPPRSSRISKTEQVSKNRSHLDLKLTTPEEIDAELLGWLREAYDLGR